MIELDIPGRGSIQLDHLVLDYNGTLALDGRIIDGVAERLLKLGDRVQLHVITADTFGSAGQALIGVACRLHVLGPGQQDIAKLDYVRMLGPQNVVSVGNGRNDCLMLDSAALSIGIIQTEGASGKTLMAADVVCKTILDALDLLLVPQRLTATLRL